jgi:flavin reductase (DIM6/NTAB) family NADH-FMN oxidoreductase RutF
MNEDAKKTALRMIPYGLYVLTAEGKNGAVAAATVNWVTQAAFAPPLVVLGVKTDSGAHAIIKETGEFALNVLGKGQQAMAFNFFKSHERDGDTIGGSPSRRGRMAPRSCSTRRRGSPVSWLTPSSVAITRFL